MVHMPAIAVVVIDVATIGVVMINMPISPIGVMRENRGSHDEGGGKNYSQYACQSSRLYKRSPVPPLNPRYREVAPFSMNLDHQLF